MYELLVQLVVIMLIPLILLDVQLHWRYLQLVLAIEKLMLSPTSHIAQDYIVRTQELHQLLKSEQVY